MALWASVTLCYFYCDSVELYQPGKLQSMLAGEMGPLGAATQGVLLGVSVLMSVPAVMVFLGVALPARASRVANLVFGLVSTLIMLVLLPGVWRYYQYFATVEIALTGTAVWLAWHWPAAPAVPADARGGASNARPGARVDAPRSPPAASARSSA